MFLGSAGLLDTRDLAEARAYYDAYGIDFVPAPDVNRPRCTVNGVWLPNVSLGYIEFDSEVTLRLSPRATTFGRNGGGQPVPASRRPAQGDYYFHVPIRGRLEADIPRHHVDCTPSRAVLISPGVEQSLRTHAGTGRLTLSVRGDALGSHVAALLGDAPAEATRFDPEVRLDEGHGRSLSGMMHWMALEVERDRSVLASPLLTARFEEFVLSWLALSQPSNHSEAIARRERGAISPRDVRRALDYIHANADQPITLVDLVSVAGVPGRTLFKHFRDTQGTTPMRYLRNLRLKRVQEELASGTPAPVSEVALRWGFAHPGRFSVEYRRRFGEAPSATARKARAA
ncbi:MAG TPA: AraC family transcriptional regulator [Burkholderiales bacterium]|nr:AraC family transcriptional regulator [Burkholderiales bacterium]